MTAQAGCFVGNDSGVSHLAAALGIPTTVFFISTDPRIWRPLGRNVTVIDRRIFLTEGKKGNEGE
jgi:ADP-heptose:LPS heptosyltransferase